MKRFVLIIAAMVAGVSLSAQKKGDMYVSGHLNLGLNSATSFTGAKSANDKASETNTLNVFSFGIAPKFGYFVADNFEVNVALKYSLGLVGSASKENENGTVEKGTPASVIENNFFVTPGVSYYVPIISEKLYYVPSFGLGFGFAANSTKSGNFSVNGDPRFAFGMFLDYLAFEYKLNANMGLTMSVGGLGYTLDTKSETNNEITVTSTNHGVDFGFDKVALGFKYYF